MNCRPGRPPKRAIPYFTEQDYDHTIVKQHQENKTIIHPLELPPFPLPHLLLPPHSTTPRQVSTRVGLVGGWWQSSIEILQVQVLQSLDFTL